MGSIDRLSEGETIPLLGFLLFVGQLGTLLEQTGWVARVVLVMLLRLFPVFLGPDFSKVAHVFAHESANRLFLRIFRSNKNLPDPKQMGSGRFAARIPFIAAGYREMESQLRGGNPPGKITSLNAVTVSMQLAAAEEVRKAEKYMPWLATTGSVTPFIGLFGTVWGVMDAFTAWAPPVPRVCARSRPASPKR